MTDKPQVMHAFDACDMLSSVSGLSHSQINGLSAIATGRTVVVPADELASLRAELIDAKVDRAKLDNEAYQRGYADAIKHAGLGEARAWLCTKDGCADVIVREKGRADAWERDGYTVHPLFLGPRRMTEAWQPIETAPKDEYVLVSCGPGGMIEACQPAEFVGKQYPWIDSYGSAVVGPEYWMPLPARPDAPAGEKGDG